MRKKIDNFAFWVVAFIFGAALIAVYKTFDNFNTVLEFIGKLLAAVRPFFVALVIAYILNLPIKRIDSLLKRRKNRFLNSHSLGISMLISYFAAAGVLILTVGAVVPALYNNLYEFYVNSSSYIENATEYIKNIDIFKRLGILQNIDNFDISGSISRLLSRINGAQMQKYAASLFSATSGVLSAVISIIASVYMLIEKERIAEQCKRIIRIFIKADLVDDVMKYTYQMNDIFTSYIYSRLICCLVMGTVCSIVLTVMGVKYAITLGMFIGLCDLIPYFGSIIATVIAIIINLLTAGLWSSVWVGLVLLVLQQIDGNILAPKIMGRSLEISPLLTVFSVVVGGELFGVAGMIFSVPVVAIIKVVAGDILDSLEKRKELKKQS